MRNAAAYIIIVLVRAEIRTWRHNCPMERPSYVVAIAEIAECWVGRQHVALTKLCQVPAQEELALIFLSHTKML
jgi:hypothetical protein